MKAHWSISGWGLLVALTGCGVPLPNAMNGAAVPKPDLSRQTPLAMQGDHGPVKVGMSSSEALAAFQEPQSFFTVSALPPGFDDSYAAKGWDTESGGFGIITHEGKVILANRQYVGLDDRDFSEIVQKNAPRGIEETFIGGDPVRFWIWDSPAPPQAPEHRLVISAARMRSGDLNVAVILGVAPIMDALGISESRLRQDQAEATRVLLEKSGARSPKE